MGDFSREVAGGAVRILWKDALSEGFRQGPAKLKRAAWIAASSMAPEVENYMKLNAPWTDQTSNARNGLAARAYQESDETGIVLFHQVTYGIYLETRFGGRYAIIDPAIEAMGPAVMRRYDRILERI